MILSSYIQYFLIIYGTGKLLANELGALLTAATGNHHDNDQRDNDHQ